MFRRLCFNGIQPDTTYRGLLIRRILPNTVDFGGCRLKVGNVSTNIFRRASGQNNLDSDLTHMYYKDVQSIVSL